MKIKKKKKKHMQMFLISYYIKKLPKCIVNIIKYKVKHANYC